MRLSKLGIGIFGNTEGDHLRGPRQTASHNADLLPLLVLLGAATLGPVLLRLSQMGTKLAEFGTRPGLARRLRDRPQLMVAPTG
jgi:hypothetical protein